MTDKRIEQLTEKLRKLNIEQEGVIRELETLSKSKKEIQASNARANNETKTPDSNGSELSVGDKVHLVNRGLFKERDGTITKIGKLVSMRLDTGQTTTRKSTNLLKQDARHSDTN